MDDGSPTGRGRSPSGCTSGTPRLRAVRLKRNFGQHPAMHAGLVRARGDVVVTMDGDLQNSPADLPRLGRGGGRPAPTWPAAAGPAGRTRGAGRFPRSSSTECCAASPPPTSPTSAAPSTPTRATRSSRCSASSASRSSRRRSCSRPGPASSRWTSSTARAQGRSRYSPLRLTRLALHVLAGFWPQPIQWAGVLIGMLCGSLARRRRRLGESSSGS